MVNCQFSVDILGRYGCEVLSQVIDDDFPAFEGEHEEGKRGANVTALWFKKCEFRTFPKNLHFVFPNLLILLVKNSKLESISRGDLFGLTGLRELHIKNCGLTKLDGDLLTDLEKLEDVSFMGNKLGEIEPHIFDHLTRLKYVSFSGNATIDAWFDFHTGISLDALLKEIRIKCKVSKKPQPSAPPAVEVETSQKPKVPSEIWSDPAFKDFTITVGETQFKIHKVYFAARSATLAEIFRSNPEAVELNLQDIPEETFKVIYDFVYCEDLPVSYDNWMELFVAAARLKIEDLVEKAAEKLAENINDENVLKIFEVANKFENEKLLEKAFGHLEIQYFPKYKVKRALSHQPEKLRELIEAKKKLDEEAEKLRREIEDE